MTDNEKLLVEALHRLMDLIRLGYSGDETEYDAYKNALKAIEQVENSKEYE